VFDDFMSACSTEVVKADGVDADHLLSLYFGRKPPFGEGKKKSEFPDAISLLSLKSRLQGDEKIYIVSEDDDLKSFCADDPSFICIETLDKLLDIYTTHTNARHEQVKQYFIENEKAIKQRITELLEASDVYNSSA
jgi:hypothetical protein